MTYHQRLAGRLAAAIKAGRVEEGQTVHVCKHCLQRVGEPHLLTCPHAKTGLNTRASGVTPTCWEIPHSRS